MTQKTGIDDMFRELLDVVVELVESRSTDDMKELWNELGEVCESRYIELLDENGVLEKRIVALEEMHVLAVSHHKTSR